MGDILHDSQIIYNPAGNVPGGICLCSQQEITVGDILNIRTVLSDSTYRQLKGTVVSSSLKAPLIHPYETGLKFHKPDQSIKKALENFIAAL